MIPAKDENKKEEITAVFDLLIEQVVQRVQQQNVVVCVMWLYMQVDR